MSNELFARHTNVDATPEAVYRWHEQPGAFERLTPPWIRAGVLSRVGGLENGARVNLLFRVGPFRIRSVFEHRDGEPARQFRGVQIKGPFARWEHTHRFEPDGETSCFLEDRISYALPGAAAGQLLGAPFVRRELERLLVYRHRILKHDIAFRNNHPTAPMKILVTGSHGLIGSALVPFLATAGHSVARLGRSGGDIVWNPAAGSIDGERLEGFDAVIHLAAEGLGGLRWTAEKKAKVRDSRAAGTRLLCETLARLNRPPKILLSASAIGFYGNRGSEILDEDSSGGAGFLAGVCREWEEATRPAAEHGIRVAHLRFGIVLSPAGGALARMLPAFRCGAGGPFGTGWQYMSWIAIDDVLGAIGCALATDKLAGPINVVGPYVTNNRDFAKTLGSVLNRPSLLRMPAFGLRLAFGELADEVLLASARVEPRKLLDAGYVFRYPNLEGALRHVLGRST